MKHLDLFSGIGGFALAARWMGWETVAFCERDPFCQKVLRKHWPQALIYDDIHTIPAEFIRDAWQPDIVTGGFPCQPFSSAGKRGGKDDDRYLWPKMLEVIATIRPRFVVGENVAGLISMALDTVLSDLEAEGYTCQAVVIPACATNAPHRRDRVWIVAHAESTGSSRRINQCGAEARHDGLADDGQTAFDPASAGLPDWAGGTFRQPSPLTEFERSGSDGKEREVERYFRGLDDGLSARLVRNRVSKLKALGNAIVPQVAHEIFKAIGRCA